MKTYDILIIGGGIVGLASAWQMLRKQPGLRLAVLEKEQDVAMHQSSRNSGVIHSGIYYRPGSLRALNCKRGYDLLLHFCREHDLPFDICGKIIVAVEEKERPLLDGIHQRGIENGLAGIRKLSAKEVGNYEPYVRAVEAVWVPQAGITDYGLVARKYAALIRDNGGEILTGKKVDGISAGPNEVVVSAGDWEGSAHYVVTCAGLYSDKIARLGGEQPGVQILPFRGEYYDLVPEREHLVRNLVYPVPNPRFPFLGVHFTRMIHGGIEAGPNAVLAFRREGYSRWDIAPKELLEILGYSGFQRLAARYWRDGLAEMMRSYSKAFFLRALQRLIPDIRAEDIVPARSGVRAMACTPEGQLHDDFLFIESPRVLNVCNAPSPAATASLAIGESIAQKILPHFG